MLCMLCMLWLLPCKGVKGILDRECCGLEEIIEWEAARVRRGMLMSELNGCLASAKAEGGQGAR